MSLTKVSSGMIAEGGVPSFDGIKFPGTQAASADVNTLDDYEEGSWTPNQGAGLTLSGAFSSVGSYTKIGRVVTVSAKLSGASTIASSAGGVICSNLPFAAETTSGHAYWGSAVNNSTGTTVVQANSSSITGVTALGATGAIYFTVTYFV